MKLRKKDKMEKGKKLKKENILLIAIVFIVVVIDQILKIWIQNGEEINIISGILTFKMSQNTNSAYGIRV